MREETVEVVHEALIREWGTLRKWVNENREKLIQKRKIEAAAIEWRDRNKLKGYLLTGRQLKDAQVFQKEKNISLALSNLAGEFIRKSVGYRRNNRFRLIGFGFIPVVFLAMIVAFFTYRGLRISHLREVVKEAKAEGEKDNSARYHALEELVKLEASLNGINLSGANLNHASFNYANLRGADLSGASFNYADLFGADLNGADLSGANLGSANLGSARFFNANLSGADLSNAFLKEANFTGADLSGANLSNAFLEEANTYPRVANLRSADLRGADLRSANLRANLRSADLRGADLRGAKLGCIKIYKSIECTDFKDANLIGAKLGCVRSFREKVVKCTDFTGAKNLTLEQVKKAKYWQLAIYDPEFRAKPGLPPQKKN